MTLKEYVEQSPARTQQAWADGFGISRAFFNQLLAGNRNPSLAVMMRIEKATSGAVPMSSWAYMPGANSQDSDTGEYVEP